MTITINKILDKVKMTTEEKTVVEYWEGDGMRHSHDDNIREGRRQINVVTSILLPTELAHLNQSEFIGKERVDVLRSIYREIRKTLLQDWIGFEFGFYRINSLFEIEDKFGNIITEIPDNWPIGDIGWLLNYAKENDYDE